MLWYVFLFTCIGFLTTMTFDALMLMASFVTGQVPDWRMIGRIAAYALTEGRLIIWDWRHFAPMPYENLIGWCVHYAVGIAYALIYGCLLLRVLHFQHSLLACLILLWLFTIMPFCVLDPIAGLGMFASHTQHPWRVIALTFFNHSLFAIALWLWVRLIYLPHV